MKELEFGMEDVLEQKKLTLAKDMIIVNSTSQIIRQTPTTSEPCAMRNWRKLLRVLKGCLTEWIVLMIVEIAGTVLWNGSNSLRKENDYDHE